MLIAKVYTVGWEVHAHTFPDNDRNSAIAWARKFLAEETSTQAIIFQESYFASGSPKEMKRIWQQYRSIPMTTDDKGDLLRQAGALNLPAGPAHTLADFLGVPLDNNPPADKPTLGLHLKLDPEEARELLNALYWTLHLEQPINQERALALAGRLEQFLTFTEGSP